MAPTLSTLMQHVHPFRTHLSKSNTSPLGPPVRGWPVAALRSFSRGIWPTWTHTVHTSTNSRPSTAKRGSALNNTQTRKAYRFLPKRNGKTGRDVKD